jgi:hypothetical protein
VEVLISPSSVLPMSTASAPHSSHRFAICTNLPAHARMCGEALGRERVQGKQAVELSAVEQSAGSRTAAALNKSHASAQLRFVRGPPIAC